jgi:alpha/beta superfamily hydrolase
MQPTPRPRRPIRRLRGRLLVSLAIVTAVIVAGCDLANPGPSSSPTARPQGSRIPEGPVRFTTPDGVELEGRIFGSGTKAIVLAHMEGSDMTAFFPLAQVLADFGYRALAFNFRGHGGSGGEGFRVGIDTRAAVDLMVFDGATQVGFVGASMGGTGAIAAAAKNPDVVGGVALSPPFKFEGVDAKIEAIDVSAPVLFIIADGDVDENGGRYRDHAIEIGRSHPETMQVLTMTGSSHGTDLFLDHGASVTENILNFMARAFG